MGVAKSIITTSYLPLQHGGRIASPPDKYLDPLRELPCARPPVNAQQLDRGRANHLEHREAGAGRVGDALNAPLVADGNEGGQQGGLVAHGEDGGGEEPGGDQDELGGQSAVQDPRAALFDRLDQEQERYGGH